MVCMKGCRKHKKMAYMKHLVKLPPFGNIVAKDMATWVEVARNIISLNSPPSEVANVCRSMYAFGSHLRVASVECYLSCSDSRMAIIFEQKCHSHSNDWNMVVASQVYVGWIEKILKLDCGWFQTIKYLFVIKWWQIMRVLQQQWNMMNMGSPLWTLNVWSQFQLHASQVFFAYEVWSRGNWKVILCWKPRGRRFKFNREFNPKIPTFDLGNNINYASLKVGNLIKQTPTP